MTITTDRKYNFGKAENETFSWNSSWDGELYHKPSGRSLYQMMWMDTKQVVEPDVKAAAIEFRAELKALQDAGKQELAEKNRRQREEDEMDIYDLFMAKIEAPNSDY